MNASSRYWPLLLLCLLLLGACKKQDAGTCRIGSVHITAGAYDATTTLSYDARQRLSQITTTGSASRSRQLTYRSDSILVTETNGSSTTRYALTTLGGHIGKLIVYTNTGTVSSVTAYGYNSAGQVVTKSVTVGSSAPVDYSFSYNNTGDALTLVNSANTASVIAYDYYADRSHADGDAAGIADFLDYGITAVTNRHLLKTTTVVNPTTGVTAISNEYTFDGDRVARLIQTAQGNATTYDYTYTCD